MFSTKSSVVCGCIYLFLLSTFHLSVLSSINVHWLSIFSLSFSLSPLSKLLSYATHLSLPAALIIFRSSDMLSGDSDAWDDMRMMLLSRNRKISNFCCCCSCCPLLLLPQLSRASSSDDHRINSGSRIQLHAAAGFSRRDVARWTGVVLSINRRNKCSSRFQACLGRKKCQATLAIARHSIAPLLPSSAAAAAPPPAPAAVPMLLLPLPILLLPLLLPPVSCCCPYCCCPCCCPCSCCCPYCPSCCCPMLLLPILLLPLLLPLFLLLPILLPLLLLPPCCCCPYCCCSCPSLSRLLLFHLCMQLVYAYTRTYLVETCSYYRSVILLTQVSPVPCILRLGTAQLDELLFWRLNYCRWAAIMLLNGSSSLTGVFYSTSGCLIDVIARYSLGIQELTHIQSTSIDKMWWSFNACLGTAETAEKSTNKIK